jgi:hypothetical protein
MNNSVELEYIKPPHTVGEPPIYKVVAVVNSLNYKPGDILDEDEVRYLCESKASTFTVTIK